MDYGQTKNSQNNQAFFTAGVGNLPEDQNSFEAENNLNLSNDAASWLPERDTRTIGSKAIFSTAEVPITAELVEKTPDLGTPDLAPPPDMSMAPAVPTLEEIKPIQFDAHAIKTEGDHISGRAISEIHRTIDALEKTGNTADFYAAIRGDENNPGMVRNNLKNSYGREVA